MAMTTAGQASNMPPGNPIRRVDFAEFEEIKRRLAENGEVKFCRCMASKNFPYCDNSHVELNNQGISNAGPLVVKANPPNVPVVARSGSDPGQPSNMPPSNPVRRVDFADVEELGKFLAQDGEKKFCRCFQSKSFPFCDGSHVELNQQGITNAGPLVMKASAPAMTAPSQPNNMPPDNPVRRVDVTDIEEIRRRFAQNGEVKFCRCMASKSFPYCDGSHAELNNKGVTNVGPMVVKAAPLPETRDAEPCANFPPGKRPSNMPASNPVRRVDFADVEELNRRFAQDGEVKFCRCMASKMFPYCDGSHVALNREGITNAGPLVVKAKAPAPVQAATPWGTPMPAVSEEAKSGNGTLENVGIKVTASVACPGCMQRFASEEIQQLHWKFMHDFPKLQLEAEKSREVEKSRQMLGVEQPSLALVGA